MKSILLVDDDTQLRTMFCKALTRHGYRVIEADSGLAGLALARQHLPDLILSDVNMPGGDGSSLLRDIRTDAELRSRQVVLMTGRPDLLTPRKGMEEGADDFLVKPVSIEAVLACLKARFSRESISWRIEDQMLAQLRSSVPPQLPHEFFTPMAGIIGLLEILREGYATFAVDEVRDIHNDLYQSALRLNRTLRNYLLILEVQNVASEQVIPNLPPREVKDSIQAGVNEALRLNNRSNDISSRISECSIIVKPGDLTRMVEELVDNACKFSRSGTAVILTLNDGGELTVTDKGRGLTAEQITHIGAFQQFDRKKYEQQGLGLGLVLVQKLAAQCGASFSIESQPTDGTQVRVSFPLQPDT